MSTSASAVHGFASLAGAVQVAPSRQSKSDRHGGRKMPMVALHISTAIRSFGGYAGLPRSMEGSELREHHVVILNAEGMQAQV